MDVLVLGGGGREHALCWSLERAPSVDRLVCAPGNAGTAEVAENRDVDATDPAAVVALAREVGADLVVIGPEAPLVAGVADALAEAAIPVFGPSAAAARLEGSKAFAKDVMAAAGVATAGSWTGTDPDEAIAALAGFRPPYVVKADGLAAGKGVRICADEAEAAGAIEEAMVEQVFGEAGRRVVLEEFLSGPEVSLFALADGRSARPLVAAQDFKRALDGDGGLNTGGMGAYSPVPAVYEAMVEGLSASALTPVVAELAARGTPYTGVLYAGLVLTSAGVQVLEFNARFGDPEAQVILPRLETDLAELLAACAAGELASAPALSWDERACVTVVLASGGYPGAYDTGKPIEGLDEAAAVPGALVFHAGTRRQGGQVLTAGGRVLAVSGRGATIAQARATAYRAADAIHFEGVHRREDIAAAPTGASDPTAAEQA